MNEITQAIEDLVNVFDEFRIRYFIGGSIGSSLNGIFRSTNDIDVILENSLTLEIIAVLEKNFILDSVKLLQNHSKNLAFNIFHEKSALKMDLFPAYNDFHSSQLDRALNVKLSSSETTFKIASAEDTILAKLLWIKKSPSERQLSDIKGVYQINRDTLDVKYLELWSVKLAVEDDLARLFHQKRQS